ncbi:hypothetical protein [Pseudomonas viridiflava]|uniref:hypothetical protein n=1 Tax=Pseudomonas viridiflava TaxID=33069 RepID=UPI000F0668B5|nr:hypothetical protein [Pseudomonas viridiflava]
MRFWAGTVVTAALVVLAGCSASTAQKIDKFATLRAWEFYRTDIKYGYFDEKTGVRLAGNFQPAMLPLRIADNDEWMDFTAEKRGGYIIFGNRLQRKTFPTGLEPIAEFIAWADLPTTQRTVSAKKLNARDEFTSIKARVVTENGTGEPLLIFKKSSLSFTSPSTYSIDLPNAREMVRRAFIWNSAAESKVPD